MEEVNIISTTIATEIVRKVHYNFLTIEYKNMHYLLAKEYGEYITNNNILFILFININDDN